MEPTPQAVLAAAQTLIDWVLAHPGESRNRGALLDELNSIQSWAFENGAE
jgi:hypothetical protein